MAQLQEQAFKRLYSAEYFDKWFGDGLRPDGRGLSVARPVSVAPRAVTSADGSAMVKVGATTVLAGVRLEVMVPSSDAPGEGQLVVSCEMTALSSPDYRPGRQPGIVHAIERRLADVLQGCGVLRLPDLCIARGQAVWVLYLDLYVLNAAGGLLDAALLAALAALRDTRVPAVHVTEEGNVERDAASEQQQQAQAQQQQQQEAQPQQQQQQQAAGGQLPRQQAPPPTVPLPLHGAPLCLTCGLYKGQLVADPDHEEEALMSASVTVVLDADQQLLGVYSVGPTSPKQLLTCAELAAARHAELMEQLEAAAGGADDMEA